MEYNIHPISIVSGLKQLERKGMGREATKSEIISLFDTIKTIYPVNHKNIPGSVQHLYWNYPNLKDNVVVFLGQHKYDDNTFFARTEDNLRKSIESMQIDNKNARYRSERGVYPERIVNGCLGYPSLSVPSIGESPYYFNLSDTSHLNGTLGVSSCHTCGYHNPLISGASGMNNQGSKQNSSIYPLYHNQVITSTIFSFDYDYESGKPERSKVYEQLCVQNPFLREFDFITIVHGVLLKDVYNKYRNSCNVVKKRGKFKAELATGFYATVVPLNYYIDNFMYLDCSPLHLINGSNNINFIRFCSQLLAGFIKNIHNDKVLINEKSQSVYQVPANNGRFSNLETISFLMKAFDNKATFLPTEKTVFRILLPSEEKYTYHSFICTYDPLENMREVVINSCGFINFKSILFDIENKRNVEKIYEFIKQNHLDSYLIIGFGFSNILKSLQSSLVVEPSDIAKYETTIYYNDACDLMLNYDNGAFYDYMVEVSGETKSPHFGKNLDYHFFIETLPSLIDKSLYSREESVSSVIKGLHNDFSKIEKNLTTYLNSVENGSLQANAEFPKFFCATSALITWVVLNRVLYQSKNEVETSLQTYIPSIILTPTGFLNYSDYLNDYVLKGGSLHNLEIYDANIMESILKMDSIVKRYVESLPIIPNYKCKVDVATITSCGGNISIKDFIEKEDVESLFEEENRKLKESLKNKVKVQNNLKSLEIHPEPPVTIISEFTSTPEKEEKMPMESNNLLNVAKKTVSEIVAEQNHANFFDDIEDVENIAAMGADEDTPPWEIPEVLNNMGTELDNDTMEEIEGVEQEIIESSDSDENELEDNLMEINNDKDGNVMSENVISKDESIEAFKLKVIQGADELGREVVESFIEKNIFTLNDYAKIVISDLQNTIQAHPDIIFELSTYLKEYKSNH